MPFPRWLARFNLRVTNHVLGPLATYLPGMGVVVHTGRKTGRRYRTPVMVFRHGDRFIIALTYGPESRWVMNVLAQGGGELETRGQTLLLSHPRLFHDKQRTAMPPVVRTALRILNVSDFLEVKVSSHK